MKGKVTLLRNGDEAYPYDSNDAQSIAQVSALIEEMKKEGRSIFVGDPGSEQIRVDGPDKIKWEEVREVTIATPLFGG